MPVWTAPDDRKEIGVSGPHEGTFLGSLTVTIIQPTGCIGAVYLIMFVPSDSRILATEYVASSMLAAKRFHQDARPDHQGRPPVASGSWVIRARAGTEVPSPLDPNLLRWPREQPD
jgi:hypothetical protein